MQQAVIVIANDNVSVLVLDKVVTNYWRCNVRTYRKLESPSVGAIAGCSWAGTYLVTNHDFCILMFTLVNTFCSKLEVCDIRVTSLLSCYVCDDLKMKLLKRFGNWNLRISKFNEIGLAPDFHLRQLTVK